MINKDSKFTVWYSGEKYLLQRKNFELQTGFKPDLLNTRRVLFDYENKSWKSKYAFFDKSKRHPFNILQSL